MKTLKNKTFATMIALILLISIATSMMLVPTASSHTPPWTVKTYAYIDVNPDPVGIGQTVYVTFGIDKVAMTTSGAYGDRWTNFTITVTKPDASKETLTGFTADDTGFSYTKYTPTSLGNYTFVLYFAGQTLTGANPPPGGTSAANSVYIGDYYSPSTSAPVTLVVQQEPVSLLPANPLPTNYWSRPINMMNNNWNTISGDWLGMADLGNAGRGYNVSTNVNPFTTAPQSGHVIWTQSMAPGGLIGGEFGSTANSNYYSTAQYECKFKATVLNGILYYTSLPGASTYPEGTVAKDIRTGQILWTKPMNGTLRCGQVYNYISPNQYGGEAYLWSTSGSTYSMYDATTGNWILDINNGVSGTLVSQQTGNSPADGSMLCYYVATVSGKPYLTMWNSSRDILMGPSGTGDPNGWMWRPTAGSYLNWSYGIQWQMPLATNISGLAISPSLGISKICSDVVLMTSAPTGNWENYQIEAGYSAITGQQLWIVNRTETEWTRDTISATSNGIYYNYCCEDETFTAYSLSTGEKVWGPSESFNTGFWGYVSSYSAQVAYGILYAGDFAGYLHAYNATTGAHLWDWYSGPSELNNVYNGWPVKVVETIADGLVFLNGGHTYNPPLFRGSHAYAINATTGKEVWQVASFCQANSATCVISDGVLVLPNAYDNQLYAYAPGPSATTVTAPNIGVTTATPITITGTVVDKSPGAQQPTQNAMFPNGLPCISDDSQGQWMEYVYEQQPMPTNATGVPVTISVIDSNQNLRTIGTATSDASGTYSMTWTPDISGNFTIIADFAGSNSYYSSSAETHIYASSPVASTPTATAQADIATNGNVMMYIVAVGIAIIIAIAIVGVLLLRKHP